MHRGPSFLTESDWEDFKRPGRFAARSAKLLSGKVISFSKKATDLVTLLRDEIHNRQDLGRWFRCWSVSVYADDGASWTAESVAAALAEGLPNFQALCISGLSTTDGLPAIARITGSKSFLRLAARRHVTTSCLTLRAWFTPAILAISVVVALAIRVLDVLSKAKSPQAGSHAALNLFDWSFWTISGASVVLGLISQNVTTFITTRTKSKSLENFLTRLPHNQESREYGVLIEDLAKRLRGIKFPRFVIIDHFERLDFTTTQVIDRYFRKYCQTAEGSEFWVIFEREDQKIFTAFLTQNPQAYGYSKTQQCRQIPLERHQKQKLCGNAARRA